jgi:hypothetical protein
MNLTKAVVFLLLNAVNCSAAIEYAIPPRGNFRIGYEDTKWIPEKIRDKEENTFRRALTHMSGDVYCIVNTENFDFSDQQPTQTVIDRVKRSDPHAEIITKIAREINGIKGDYIEIITGKGTKLPFRVIFFVHSGPHGSIQLMVRMPNSVRGVNDADIQQLINGIELKKK